MNQRASDVHSTELVVKYTDKDGMKDSARIDVPELSTTIQRLLQCDCAAVTDCKCVLLLVQI